MSGDKHKESWVLMRLRRLARILDFVDGLKVGLAESRPPSPSSDRERAEELRRRVLRAVRSGDYESAIEWTEEKRLFASTRAGLAVSLGKTEEARLARDEARFYAEAAIKLRAIRSSAEERYRDASREMEEQLDALESGRPWPARPRERVALVRTGRNLRGVPCYEGDSRRPSHEECVRSAEWTAGLAIAAVFAGTSGFVSGAFGSLLLAVAAIAMGYIACERFHRRCRLAGLLSIHDAATMFGAQDLAVLLDTRSRGVEPVCIINGEEFYRLGDLGEAATLLRAASAPCPPAETLLRPAGNAVTSTESLLRPARGTGEDCHDRVIGDR